MTITFLRSAPIKPNKLLSSGELVAIHISEGKAVEEDQLALQIARENYRNYQITNQFFLEVKMKQLPLLEKKCSARPSLQRKMGKLSI
ncbi:hypothetical protein N9U42_03980 [Luminiphilus sp.]|nr:hypothetical protein [Luminiphilus sp.]